MQSVVCYVHRGGLGAGPQIGHARAVLSLTTHAWSAGLRLVGAWASLYRPARRKARHYI